MPTPTPATDNAPIENFSHCHEGIVRHLDTFGELPALLAPANRAREIAEQTLKFFRSAVYDHHAEEERELFPAVLASATKGEERDHVQVMVNQLTAEHRAVEAAWTRLEPELKHVAKGQSNTLNTAAVEDLVRVYKAHAQFEEREFLPLSQTILGRNGNHMAALGLSLHMRHAKHVSAHI